MRKESLLRICLSIMHEVEDTDALNKRETAFAKSIMKIIIQAIKDDVGIEMREKLAELCHTQWSGWMEYLFSKCSKSEDGTITIPKWAVERWKRQMNTDYNDLSEEEKNSDRNEADRFITIIQEKKRNHEKRGINIA